MASISDCHIFMTSMKEFISLIKRLAYFRPVTSIPIGSDIQEPLLYICCVYFMSLFFLEV